MIFDKNDKMTRDNDLNFNLKKNRIKQVNEFAKLIQKGIKTSGKLKCGYYNFLGWLENRKMCNEIKLLFTDFINGSIFYDWVNGNDDFQEQLGKWEKSFNDTKKNITRKEIIDYIMNYYK